MDRKTAEQIDRFLENNPEFDKPKTVGNTALHLAVGRPNRNQTLKMLLECPKVDVNILTSDRVSALGIALRRENIEAVDLILAHPEVDVNLEHGPNKLPLLLYLIGLDIKEHSKTTFVSLLLKHPNIEANVTDKEGCNALHYAVVRRNTDLIQVLVEDGRVDVNGLDFCHHKMDFQGNRTPLMKVIRTNEISTSQQVNAVKTLLKHPSIDVNVKNDLGLTALYMASLTGNLELLDLILMHKQVDVNTRLQGGQTVLQSLAVTAQERASFSLILHHPEIDLTLTDDYNQNVLHYAVNGGSMEKIEEIVSVSKTNLLTVDKNGRTPATLAKKKKWKPCMKFLEKYKIDIELVDEFNPNSSSEFSAYEVSPSSSSTADSCSHSPNLSSNSYRSSSNSEASQSLNSGGSEVSPSSSNTSDSCSHSPKISSNSDSSSTNCEASQSLASGGSGSHETDYNSNCSQSNPDSVDLVNPQSSSSLASNPNSSNLINSKSTKIGKLPRLCWFCGADDVKLYKCGGCKRALYCSDRCVESDWDVHGGWCVKKQQRKLAKKSGKLD